MGDSFFCSYIVARLLDHFDCLHRLWGEQTNQPQSFPLLLFLQLALDDSRQRIQSFEALLRIFLLSLTHSWLAATVKQILGASSRKSTVIQRQWSGFYQRLRLTGSYCAIIQRQWNPFRQRWRPPTTQFAFALCKHGGPVKQLSHLSSRFRVCSRLTGSGCIRLLIVKQLTHSLLWCPQQSPSLWEKPPLLRWLWTIKQIADSLAMMGWAAWESLCVCVDHGLSFGQLKLVVAVRTRTVKQVVQLSATHDRSWRGSMLHDKEKLVCFCSTSTGPRVLSAPVGTFKTVFLK